MKLIELSLLCMVLPVSGCLSDSQAGAAVGFDVILTDQYPANGIYGNREIEFISNQQAYDDTVSRYSSLQPADINFSNNQVILLNMGPRSTGGYSVTVSSVAESNGTLTVYVTETSPAPGCMVPQAITSPYVFVRVHSVARIRTVVVDEAVTNCNAP